MCRCPPHSLPCHLLVSGWTSTGEGQGREESWSLCAEGFPSFFGGASPGGLPGSEMAQRGPDLKTVGVLLPLPPPPPSPPHTHTPRRPVTTCTMTLTLLSWPCRRVFPVVGLSLSLSTEDGTPIYPSHITSLHPTPHDTAPPFPPPSQAKHAMATRDLTKPFVEQRSAIKAKRPRPTHRPAESSLASVPGDVHLLDPKVRSSFALLSTHAPTLFPPPLSRTTCTSNCLSCLLNPPTHPPHPTGPGEGECGMEGGAGPAAPSMGGRGGPCGRDCEARRRTNEAAQCLAPEGRVGGVGGVGGWIVWIGVLLLFIHSCMHSSIHSSTHPPTYNAAPPRLV